MGKEEEKENDGEVEEKERKVWYWQSIGIPRPLSSNCFCKDICPSPNLYPNLLQLPIQHLYGGRDGGETISGLGMKLEERWIRKRRLFLLYMHVQQGLEGLLCQYVCGHKMSTLSELGCNLISYAYITNKLYEEL